MKALTLGAALRWPVRAAAGRRVSVYVPIRYIVVACWDGRYAMRDRETGLLLPERYERRYDAQREVARLRREQIAAAEELSA